MYKLFLKWNKFAGVTEWGAFLKEIYFRSTRNQANAFTFTLWFKLIYFVQAKLKESISEAHESRELAAVSRECQQELSAEIAELKERYAEVLDLLHDSQEQLRKYTKKVLIHWY